MIKLLICGDLFPHVAYGGLKDEQSCFVTIILWFLLYHMYINSARMNLFLGIVAITFEYASLQ